GFDYYWTDKYAQNIISKGFENSEEKIYQCVTAFELFEHMVNPVEEMEKILIHSDNIIFSTVLTGNKIPDLNWWYYGFNHGQHVALFTSESLRILGAKFDLNFYTNGANFHMFTKKKMSNYYFKFLIKASKYGLYNIIKQTIKSRTDSDAKLLIKT
ncbi:MAG: hypothetical protein H7296_12560, partial [Bacteroidia bacterium]|nr:hypothetical protein [Bacteroidia bacterium]